MPTDNAQKLKNKLIVENVSKLSSKNMVLKKNLRQVCGIFKKGRKERGREGGKKGESDDFSGFVVPPTPYP